VLLPVNDETERVVRVKLLSVIAVAKCPTLAESRKFSPLFKQPGSLEMTTRLAQCFLKFLTSGRATVGLQGLRNQAFVREFP